MTIVHQTVISFNTADLLRQLQYKFLPAKAFNFIMGANGHGVHVSRNNDAGLIPRERLLILMGMRQHAGAKLGSISGLASTGR